MVRATDPTEQDGRDAPIETTGTDSSNIQVRSDAMRFGRRDVLNVVRGFCMGAADTVPGVSGGTVALIMGHYSRLVTAISRIDVALVRLIINREFRKAAIHLDLQFLCGLAVGIVAGIVSLAGLMHWLLEHQLPETFAAFFGLVIASVLVVRKYIDRWRPSCFISFFTGAVVAIGISQLPQSAGSESLPYLFFAATIAICAMILPGISGAFILLLFGVYHSITGLIKSAAQGDLTLESLTQIGVFCAGCLVGLLSFSRILKWLLANHRSTTMSGLMGLMVGSLVKLWPLQLPTEETAGLEFKQRVFEYVSPVNWPGSFASLVAIAIIAGGMVLLLEKMGEMKAES